MASYKKTVTLGDSTTARTPVVCLAFSVDGLYLASGSDRTVTVWNISDGKPEHFFTGSSSVLCLHWTSLGNSIYCGYQDGGLVILVPDNEKRELHITGFKASQQPLQFISVHNSGFRLATAGQDEVRIWQLDSAANRIKWDFFKLLPSPPTMVVTMSNPVIVTSLLWPTNDANFIMVCYFQHGIITWAIKDGNINDPFQLKGSATAANLSPDGTRLAISTNHGYDVYSCTRMIPLRSFAVERKEADSLLPALFIHGGRMLLGGSTTVAFIWDVGTGILVQSFRHRVDIFVTSLAANYSPITDTFRIATATRTAELSRINLWQVCEIGSNGNSKKRVRFTPRLISKVLGIGILLALAIAIMYAQYLY